MSRVVAALSNHAKARPSALALVDERLAFTYSSTVAESVALSQWIIGAGIRRAALLADNSVAWAIWDLAALKAGITLIPLPGFFSDAQLSHILADAGIDTVISDDHVRIKRIAARGAPLYQAEIRMVAGRRFQLTRMATPAAVELPTGIAKVTYTSGTTGTPKGVLLKAESMEQVALSLVTATGATARDRHLSLLPLATLLENIAGIYAPLLAGGCSVLYGQSTVGVQGASGVDPFRILNSLNKSQATTAITLPQLLQALVAAREAGGAAPERLRYLAVGGAPVSRRLLQAAERCGLPVFEGYGLSECASVVAANGADTPRPGSVGRPLPHARVRIAADGEIVVGGALFEGYLHDPRAPGAEWPTGDFGHLDEDGYLHITGRKKNIFITAFGRNVAPEWVEAELTAQPAIAQAAVFGEARPFNVAVIVPRPNAGETVPAALAAANRRLPDYAQVREFIVSDLPFTPANGLCTANGRLRRDAIAECYGASIAAFYGRAQAAS